MTHGTPSSYNAGCRCGHCREANSERSRERRRRKALAETTAAPVEVERRPPTREAPAPLRIEPGPRVVLPGTQAIRRPYGRSVLPRPARPARPRGHQVVPAGPPGSWDAYAQALSLWSAGLGPSPTLLFPHGPTIGRTA